MYCMQVIVRLVMGALLLNACTGKTPSLFQQVPSKISGITFINRIEENDMLNMINYQYLYNGGGVGIGDFNNDGLPDIYFTSSLQQNRLYLNKGNLSFEDVTEQAGVGGEKKWCRGVTVVDINNDGLLDMYVCAAAWQNPELKKDILYVNKGVDQQSGVPRFAEMAAAYGFTDTVSTHMAAFFDYDNDGDLDLYLVVNDLNNEFPSTFRKIRNDGTAFTNDILYRCDWNEAMQRPYYTNVTREAGITWEGNGLGISILDINNDGWKDIYVSNDYLSGNLLYINNRNGSFTNQNELYFRKGSLNAMGNDVGDINNDGLPDIVEMDMMPEDNFRQKMMMNPVDYNWYLYSNRFGFPYQTVRNSLQLNRGPRLLENDSTGIPFFSEIAHFSGIAHTDWSWAALLMDLDNDGFKDLMTTNGLPKDVTDLDFVAYREQNTLAGLNEALQLLPTVHIPNYVFRNNGDCTFSNATSQWGWNFPTYSAGIAYADFDGDGDMDVVINNTNMEATLLENKSNELPQRRNYLRLRFRGDTSNLNGIGTIAHIYYSGQQQMGELTPYKGYMSTVENMLHFGLDTCSRVDSIVIRWPGGQQETLINLAVNQTLLVSRSFNTSPVVVPSLLASGNWFSNITRSSGLLFRHQETDFVDFNLQRQLPYKFSQGGPVLASGDLNGDGLTDLVVGGSAPYPALVFIQQPNGRFEGRIPGSGTAQTADDNGLCLFDADGDGDLDLYIARGGYQLPKDDPGYTDVLLLNDGKGNFTPDSLALPRLLASTAVVTNADVDSDGDQDILVFGRVVPGAYPQPESGYLLRNISSQGKARFELATAQLAPELEKIGMITAAVWQDLDGDGFPDLVVTGEWMGIHFFKNEKGVLKRINNPADNRTGWWTALAMADVDGDGDADLIAGNFGTNSYFHASAKEPLTVYGNDYDGNGRWNMLLSQWNLTVMNGSRKEYPIAGRDQLAEEMPSMKKQFANYYPYAKADMTAILKPFNRKNEQVLRAGYLESVWLENTGGFNFTVHPLPKELQWSPVRSILAGDYNGDGFTDLVVTGNEYSMHPLLGRVDASCGWVLQGNGKGQFRPLSIRESGLFLTGDTRSLVPITINGRLCLAAGQNNDQLLVFRNNILP